MPSFKYVIELSEQDRTELIDIVTKGSSSARKILRANILLVSDKRNEKYMTVAEIAETYHTTPTTVQTVEHHIVKTVSKLPSTERSVKHHLFLQR